MHSSSLLCASVAAAGSCVQAACTAASAAVSSRSTSRDAGRSSCEATCDSSDEQKAEESSMDALTPHNASDNARTERASAHNNLTHSDGKAISRTLRERRGQDRTEQSAAQQCVAQWGASEWRRLTAWVLPYSPYSQR